MGQDDQEKLVSSLVISSKDYFKEIVSEAVAQRKIKTLPMAESYLVDLLESYVTTEKLFDEFDSSGKRTSETLAETYLRAHNAEPRARFELLKKLADRSLYISGFFGDSLQRKLVDIDYYAEMGGAAYAGLAESTKEDLVSRMYKEFSGRFLEYAEVLTYISTNAQVQSEENILRLFETYARTGSDYAREKLLEKGLIAVPLETLQHKKQ